MLNFYMNPTTYGVDVILINNSPLHASFLGAKLLSGKQELDLPICNLYPKTRGAISIDRSKFVLNYPMTIQLSLMNNLGGYIEEEHYITHPKEYLERR